MLTLRPQNGSLIPTIAGRSSFWATGLLQSLIEIPISADMGFWPAVAAAVLGVHQQAICDAPADLRGIDVIVPSWAHAQSLRNALHARLTEAGHARFVPPRISTLSVWSGDPTDSSIERRIELFAALRENEWIRAAFGQQPGSLWSLASRIDAVCDELTLAAVEGPQAFEKRLQASLARHFQRRAMRALQPQAQLVLQLWRAVRGQGSAAAALLAALAARTQNATRPIVFVALQPVPGWINAWLESLAKRVPVLLVRADVSAAVAADPLLAAAWPELVGGSVDAAPMAERARSVKATDAARAPTLLEASTFEEQAVAVCNQVVAWLQTPGQGDLFAARVPTSIALVAIDRVAARRVRALLERVQILVRDETGWKLSTTSAAGAVMRLFDLAANGFHHRDLLDWLKSPFTLSGFKGKAYLVESIERVIRRGGIVQGLGAILLALQEKTAGESGENDPLGANHWLRTLEMHVGRLGSTAATMATLLQALEDALEELGMRTALAEDPVGIEVLRVLDDLRFRTGTVRDIGNLRTSAAEFRALLAARFEELAVTAGAIESPIVMVSLSAAALRDFDAAVLIGVDAGHFPALPPELLFFSNAVRTDLGLSGTREAMAEQLADLAALLVRVPRVVATWCSHVENEPRPLAAWFARLRAVAAAAGQDPQRRVVSAPQRVEATATERPAPPAPQRLGPRISASQYQSLVNCPYQFYARHLLRLRDLDEVVEEPTPSEYGKAVHEILARFHLRWRDVDLREVSPAERASSLSACADAVFDPLVERRPGFAALRRQFADTQTAYLAWLDKRIAEGWSFLGAEIEQSATLELGGDVRSIELFGRIDRIDAREEAIEVLDYKTQRRQKLSEDLSVAGENVQLPFYGLLFAKPVSGASFVFLQRTSDRQDQVGSLPPRQPYPALVEALRIRLREDLSRIARGAPLPALGNEEVCGWCEMRGICRRDFWCDAGKAP
jgi:ATP-dependent helicase/nuclease subunit B